MMICTLMNKNTEVFKLEIDSGDIIWTGDAINPKYAPISIEIDDGVVNRADTAYWYSHRCIPASRDKLCEGMLKMGYEFWGNVPPTFLLEKSFGLSLSDQYWLKPENSNIEWKDVNYFENDFSDDVGKALFDNKYVSTPNLNSPCNSSDGWLKKKWAIINGKRCLIKSGSFYFQEPYNEVIATNICEKLKINHTDYSLYLYQNGDVCSICENIITPSTELISANDILKAFLPNPRANLYDHFLTCCNRLGIKNVSDRLDEMLVLDFIIGNTDRHLRNFGVIRNVETLKYEGFAPIFDTGTSLLCNVPTEQIEYNCEISAKPFLKTQSEQIKLVQHPERFEIEKLKSIPEFAREILYANNDKFEQRKNKLCEVLSYRISTLDKTFSKGYQSISVDSSVPQLGKSKNKSL